ncbi:MAG TPA: ABC-2 family transporter protein [Verrucomicrobiae bacterium]
MKSEIRNPKSEDATSAGGTSTGEGNLPPVTHHAPRVTRYARIYAALWKNSVTREMTFKSNFLLWIVVELLWFALQVCFINVLYLHTESIGTWTKWQVVLLIGASHFIQEVFQAFFLINCTNLSELVRTGKLDFLLLLPANTRFIVSLRQVDLGSFVNAASALVVMFYAAHRLQLSPSLAQLAGFVGLCAFGILIHYSLMFLLATVSFWTVKAQGIVWGYYNLFQLARMPDEAFRGLFKAVFTFALPVLLVSNVPVRVLADKLPSPALAFILVGMALACALVSEVGWRFSVRHYTSASS